jgi:hypothetical protein
MSRKTRCVFGHGLHVLYGMLIDLRYDLGNSPSSFDTDLVNSNLGHFWSRSDN